VDILNPPFLLYRVRRGAGGYSQSTSFIVQGARGCRYIFSTRHFYCTGCEGVQVHILNPPVLLYRVRVGAGGYSQPAGFIVQGARGCRWIFSTREFNCTGCEGVQVDILNPLVLLYRVRGGAGGYSQPAGFIVQGARGCRWRRSGVWTRTRSQTSSKHHHM